MRYGHWVDAIMGLILLTVPTVRWLKHGPTVLYVDVLVGLSLLAWAIITYLKPLDDMPIRRGRASQA